MGRFYHINPLVSAAIVLSIITRTTFAARDTPPKTVVSSYLNYGCNTNRICMIVMLLILPFDNFYLRCIAYDRIRGHSLTVGNKAAID